MVTPKGFIHRLKLKKNALYLRVNVFSTNLLIGEAIFTSPTGDETAIFTWSSEPRDALAACSARAKGVYSFLS